MLFQDEFLKQKRLPLQPQAAQRPISESRLLPRCDTAVILLYCSTAPPLLALGDEGRDDTVLDTNTALKHSSSQVLRRTRAGEGSILHPKSSVPFSPDRGASTSSD